MSTIVLTDVTTWVAGYDMTTDLNSVSLKAEVEDKDATTFGAGGWRKRQGGLRDVTADLSGLWQADTVSVDSDAFTNLGVADRVMTVSLDGTAGSPAFMFQAGSFSYEIFDQVGELAPFSLNARGTNKAGLIRGQVSKPKGTQSATGAVGSAVNLGAVASGQYLYAAVHVFTAGTTVTLQLQSDDASGFSSPSSAGSAMSAITTAGGTWMTRVAGPITDTWFRFNATAITGSFTMAAAIGIGS
ncbi:hypothetical protein ACIBI0_38415 [Microbispora rosea]|uniref:hypothetical protein n=1 Tax=Microbispora rosea TaxID=58117 RepID=UPI0037A0FA5A